MRKDKILGMLPDPFLFADGTRVKTVADWERRRQEIKDSVIELEFGGMPPKPDAIRLERMTEGGKGKVRANRRGFTVIKFNRTELAPDMYHSGREDGIYPFWPDLTFSAISAWAWGYHRVIDAVYSLDYIDTDHIAITGHSRGGKTVLLAGATDKRIQYVNPNGSGAHSCGCYRFEQKEEPELYTDARSERLEDLFRAVPYWMGPGMRQYIGRETELPHDMHFVKALIAPRVLLETNGYGDIWANPRGSWLTHLAAKEVWKFYGAEQKCQTWYREGPHLHRWANFNALFDLLEDQIHGTSLWQERVPYDDMDRIHDWECPAGGSK